MKYRISASSNELKSRKVFFCVSELKSLVGVEPLPYCLGYPQMHCPQVPGDPTTHKRWRQNTGFHRLLGVNCLPLNWSVQDWLSWRVQSWPMPIFWPVLPASRLLWMLKEWCTLAHWASSLWGLSLNSWNKWQEIGNGMRHPRRPDVSLGR